VYVSTAYPTSRATALGKALDLLRLLLVAFLGASGLAVIVRGCATTEAAADRTRIAGGFLAGDCRRSLGLAVFALALGGSAFLVLYGAHALDYQRCPIRGWLASALLVAICFVLAEFRVGPHSRVALLMGILALGYSGLVVAAVPCKEHAYRGGMLSPNSTVVLAVAAIPALFGISCIVGYVSSARRPAGSRQSPAAHMARRVALRHGLAAFAIVAIGAAAGIRFFWGEIREGSASGWQGWLLWCLGALLIAVLASCWSLDRHSPVTATPLRRPVHQSLALLTLVVGTATASAIAGAMLLRAAVGRSRYLGYHLSSPRWTAEVGAWGLAVVALACACSLAFTLARWKGGRGAPAARPTPVFRAAALALGLTQLFAVCWLSGSRTLVRAIVCVEEETGKIVWTCEGLAGPEGPLHRLNSPATPTPVLWKDRVFAFFGSAGVMCCSTKGNLLWTNEAIRFTSPYGAGASPIVAGETLVVVSAAPPNPRIYGLSCESGKIVWQTDMRLGSAGIPFWGQSRTPLVKKVRGRDTLLVWGFDGLAGYDLEDGRFLWCYPIGNGGGDMVASPTADGERVYCAGTRETIALALSRLGSGDDPIVWRTKTPGTNCASPVVHRGMLFLVSDNGIASCLDARTGERLWRARLRGEYYASPVAFGDAVLFCNAAGATTVVAAERSFREIRTNDLQDQTLATCAPVNGHLLMRTSGRLYCLQSEASPRLQIVCNAPGN